MNHVYYIELREHVIHVHDVVH